MGSYAVDLLLDGKSDCIVAEVDGRIVSFDIKFALTVDKMYKKKLKEGALEGFTPEQIGTMEEICAFRASEIKRLYDIHLSLCE
jgi:hypothetical protein